MIGKDRPIFFFLIFLFFLMVAVPVTAAPLADYHFDECYWDGSSGEVVDASGNGYNGTAKNGVATVAGGQVCRAGKFADDGYVVLPGFPDFTTAFTITAWIKTVDNSQPGQRVFADDENNSHGYALSLGDGGAGRLRFYSWGVSPVVLDTPSVINNDIWYFVAAVADIVNHQRHVYVYAVDGTLINHTSSSFTGSWGTDGGLASIGGETNNGETGNRFIGFIDEVEIFNEALTKDEIAAVRSQTHDCACTEVVADYHFDECFLAGTTGEVRDSSGRGHNGTVVGEVSTEDSVVLGGGLCRAGVFAGSSDYVTIDDAPELNPPAAFSASVWFKADSLSTWNGVVSKLTDVNHHTGRGWNIQVGRAQRIASLMADAAGNYVYLRSSTIPRTGVWYHVVLVHDADETNKLYVNGTLEASNHHGIAFTNNSLQVGKFYTNSNGLCFAGAIDEVSLFADSLNDDQVRDLYDRQRDGKNWDGSVRHCPQCTFDALASYYLDECSWDGSPGEVLDSSGNGYNGRAMNSVTTVDGGRVCRAGAFADNGYVALPGFPDLTGDFTLTAWMRTRNRAARGQRIFADDERNTHGYALSLGDGGAGRLRFYSRGVSPVVLDTPSVINNDVWYFVAAVADIVNHKRHIYVFSSDGTLISHASGSFTGSWGTDGGLASIGGETNHGETANRFIGNLDEVQVFHGAIDQSGLAVILKQQHGCSCVKVQADYRFDECLWAGIAGEVADSSGNGHDGTAKNGAVTESSADVDGGICRVGHFDGQNDYVEVPSSTDFNPPAGFSVSTWFRADSLSTWNGVVSKLTNVNHHTGRGWNIQVGKAQGIASLMADSSGHYVYLRSGIKPETEVWYHVVLVHGPDNVNDLYVNGSLRASNHHGIGFTGNPLQVGKFYTDSNGLFFNGRVDEVKIFAGVLTASQVLDIYQQEASEKNWDGTERTCSSCSSVDHFVVSDENDDRQALACRAELITIQAVDAGGNLLTGYTGTVSLAADNGALWYDALSGLVNDDPPQGAWSGNGHGSAAYAFSTADQGQIKLWLRDSDLPAASDSEVVQVSVADGSAAGSLAETYHRAGFRVVWDNPGNTVQLSGKPSDQGWNAQTVELQAVRVNPVTEVCESVLDGSIVVEAKISYLDPASGSLPLRLNGTDVDENWTAVTLDFNHGEAPLVFRYADAGKLQLEIRYDSDGNDTFDMFCVNNPTVVFRPLGFSIFSTTPDWEADHGADSSVFVKAGTTFNLSARAVVWQQDDDADNDGVPDAGANLADNNVTANYQAVDNAVSHVLVEPSGGAGGSLETTSMDFAGGSGEISAQTFSEVGIVKVTVTDSDYLGSGTSITGTSVPVGRFIPDHFAVQSTAVSLAPTCSAFTYLGQDFGYQDAPQITITAQNSGNEETQNYRDNFFKLPATLTPSYSNNVNGRTLVVSPAAISLAPASSQTVTVADTFSYLRETTAPFAADFDLTLVVADGDGVLYGSDGNFVIAAIGGTQLRSGRLAVADNYGPENEDITHSPLYTQYWDGSGWQLNSDDSCTSGIAFDSSRAHVTSNPEISSGRGYLTVDRPAGSTPGTITICPVAPDWLSCSGSSCCGTFTFGIYRGNDRLIMRMEVPE